MQNKSFCNKFEAVSFFNINRNIITLTVKEFTKRSFCAMNGLRIMSFFPEHQGFPQATRETYRKTTIVIIKSSCSQTSCDICVQQKKVKPSRWKTAPPVLLLFHQLPEGLVITGVVANHLCHLFFNNPSSPDQKHIVSGLLSVFFCCKRCITLLNLVFFHFEI